jgi:polyhydroxyalkanoate synthesis regulator phasin
MKRNRYPGDGSSDEIIRDEIQRILSLPVKDESQVLKIITEAILQRCTDTDLINQVVHQTVSNYETQLRVFMIANAKRSLMRIQKLSEYITDMEDTIMHPGNLSQMETKDVVNMYGKMRAGLKEEHEYIKKVMDMRLEAVQAQAALSGTGEIQDDSPSGIGNMTALQRDRVRKIIDGLVKDIDETQEGNVNLLEEHKDEE